jgi:hypothetical protein
MKYNKIEPQYWSTSDLFNYCSNNFLISSDDEFEDWINDRTDLLRIVLEDIDE